MSGFLWEAQLNTTIGREESLLAPILLDRQTDREGDRQADKTGQDSADETY